MIDLLRHFELLAESQSSPREEALVNFYRISYGTILGTVFASLYPDCVGRFLLDGIVSGHNYYFGSLTEG